MPQRTRPHVLEEESRRFFESLAPSEWVIRSKSHDYGIDLEVEIFDSGQSTGLIFYVQLKGTDSEDQADFVRILVDRLDYYKSLDIPTLIVRYSSKPPKAMMKWHFNVNSGPDLKTAAITFSEGDELTADKFVAIKRTLEVRRAAMELPISEKIGLLIASRPEHFAQAYIFDSAVEKIVQGSSVFKLVRSGSDAALTIEILTLHELCIFKIDEITSVSIQTDFDSANDLHRFASYGLILILDRSGTSRHARDLANHLLHQGVKSPSRELSMAAINALMDDPEAAVELAILNGIHETQDIHFLGLLKDLQDAPRRGRKQNRAIQNLFRAAVGVAEASSQTEWAAALNYSLGNVHRAEDEYLKAVKHYKRAARIRPAYIDTPYFLGELASVLFMKRRYAHAAKLYERAYAAQPSPTAAFLTGDALLFAGSISLAKERFDLASDGDDPRINLEASLKASLCSGLERAFGVGVIRRQMSAAAELVSVAERGGSLPRLDWNDVLALDPLDPLANYNGALQSYSRGQVAEAVGRFLVTAFAQPADVEAWYNALGCAYAIDAELLAAVLTLSIWYCGREPYARMRERIVEADTEGSVIADLDKMVAELIEQELVRQGPGTIVRVIYPNGYDLIFPNSEPYTG